MLRKEINSDETKSESEDDYKHHSARLPMQTRERGAQLRSEVLSQTHKPSPNPRRRRGQKTKRVEKTEEKLKRRREVGSRPSKVIETVLLQNGS